MNILIASLQRLLSNNHFAEKKLRNCSYLQPIISIDLITACTTIPPFSMQLLKVVPNIWGISTSHFSSPSISRLPQFSRHWLDEALATPLHLWRCGQRLRNLFEALSSKAWRSRRAPIICTAALHCSPADANLLINRYLTEWSILVI